MKLSTDTANIIGDKTGNVIRRSIVAVLAPATRAASSSDAPKRRKTGASNMTLNQMPPVEVCTQTMPQKLYGLKIGPWINGRPLAKALRKPKVGSRRRIQARVRGQSGLKSAIEHKD